MPVDSRTQKLAKLLVKYSVFVKPNENVIISGSSEAEDLIAAIYKEVILAGGHPVLRFSPKGLTYFFYKYAKRHQIEKYPDIYEDMINKSHKLIGVGSESNTKELSSCDSQKITTRSKVMKKISDLICNNKPKMNRVSTSYPTNALAQDAEMSLTEYENFFYNACFVDWKTLSKKMHKINSHFKENSKVHLIGEGIDLKMQVHGKLSTVCDGKENMPDGEVFMAPFRESANGWIKFDYPSIENGKEVSGIYLRFENGKAVEMKADKNEELLREKLSIDENASHIGEFGIGCNPKITKYTNNLLFDEKIGGTIHLAMGMAYKDNGGGNDSAIHWDIVKSMKKAKLVVDGKIIQENGEWRL